jgi:hypothetical protein
VSGPDLDTFAEFVYACYRREGETDEALRARCRNKFESIWAPPVALRPKPEVYGATCQRCNEHNPHALRPESGPFTCYGCRR